jgi:TrwC relaxase
MTTTVSVPRAGHDVGYVNAGRAGGCAGAMSYYARPGEPPGQWAGRGAEKLGLTGLVDPDVIQDLYMKNIGPDGEVLARTRKQDGVQDVAVARAVRAYQRKHPYASATELDEVRARERAKAGKTSVPYFDWQSTGIDYSVQISSDAPADQLAHLLEVVDQVAEIPQAIRAGATVRRVS